MPIDEENKILFCHIPRTGGTSIEKELGIYGDWHEADRKIMFGKDLNGNYLQHLTFNELKAQLNVNLDQYFKFSIIRKPISKLLSEYRWFNCNYFQGFVEKARSTLRNEDWSGDNIHFRHQKDFLSSELDKVYLFGDITEVFLDLDDLCEQNVNARHDNKSSKVIEKKSFLRKNQECIQILKELYKKDFQMYDCLKKGLSYDC